MKKFKIYVDNRKNVKYMGRGNITINKGILFDKINPNDIDTDKDKTLWVNASDSQLYFGDKVLGSGNNIDDWIKKYLIDPPPHINLDSFVDTKIIYIHWEYPPQITVGFLNQGLPYVKSLHCEYSINSDNPVNKTNAFILQDNEANDYVKRHETGIQPVNGIIFIRNQSVILENNTTLTDNQIYNFTFTDGVTRRCYVHYDSSIASLTEQDTMYINIYYKNYSGNVDNNLTITGFLQVGKPSKPLNVRTDSITYSSMSFHYDPPSITDDYNNTNDIPIKDYKIMYELKDNTVRYQGLARLSPQNSFIIDTNFQETISSLYPDSIYSIQVQAKNNVNPNYGAMSDIVYTTTSYINPVNLNAQFNLVFQALPLSSITAKKVIDDSIVTNLLLYDTTLCPSYDIPVAIHQIQNRGSTSSNILKIESFLSTNNTLITGPVLNFNGFPATLPSSQSQNSMTLSPVDIKDSYTNDAEYKRGYYLESSFRFSFYKDILQSSRFLNYFELTTNTSLSSRFNFYFDSTSTTPSINQFNISIQTANVYFVSGIRVIYGTNILKLETLGITGLGQYFYNKDQIIEYANEDIGGSIPIGNRKETNLSNVPLVDKDYGDLSVTVNNINSNVPYIVSGFSNRIFLSVRAYSVNGNVCLKKYGEVLVMQDPYSVTLIKDVLLQNIQPLSSSTRIGYRVWGGKIYSYNVPPLTDNNQYYKNIPYDHQRSIVDTQYNEELQIVNGKFRTRANTNSYKNYQDIYNNINYSVNEGNEYRFATFAWIFSNPNTDTFTYLNIDIMDASQTFFNWNVAYTDGYYSKKLLIHYRFEDIADNNLTTLSGDNFSTYWINGNGNDGNTAFISGGNRMNINIDPLYGFFSSSYNSTTKILSFKLSIPFAIPSEYYERITSYVRIGIPQSSDYSFSYIRAYLS